MKITRNNKVRDASEAEAEAAKALMQSVTAQREKIEKRRKGLGRQDYQRPRLCQGSTCNCDDVDLRAQVNNLKGENRLLKQNTSEVLKANLVQQHAKYNKLMTKFQNEVSAHASTMATKQL
ncbi:hypothetical protein A4X09_0g6402 [Tilletia walkeri]|uniref:Uncharacterized protein n=1 Tax=Tilletia walkeri TaxID=117179 RepID=A0A8X7T1Z5_9BASI|nr:hypothetical protein A4X09_0g6402 [Tilletia walkeri]